MPDQAAAPAVAQPVHFDGAPSWYRWALNEVGTREEPENAGPAIQRYIDLAHCGAQGLPWCAIFMNAALEANGIKGTRSASSQSPRSNPNFVQLAGPALGAIAVFFRGGRNSGLGHVGFYRGETAGYVYVLGGNEGDMVQIEALPKNAGDFGLLGYYWPLSVPRPKIAPVIMPAGTPSHQTQKVT